MSITTSIHLPVTKAAPVRKALRPRDFIDGRKKYFLSKRVMDITGSFLFICLILSWLVPVIGVLIRLDTKGPVFFVQRRVGRGGRSFRCYKFRTMFNNREADQKQASDNDERITRVGKFLRKSNMDEFPQFLNVLWGHMSIVGPRPHMYADCTKFSSVIPRYKIRNLVKPGITGLAQVKGFHGQANNQEAIFKRYQWDVFYIRNASLPMDLAIFFKTAFQRLFYCFRALRFCNPI